MSLDTSRPVRRPPPFVWITLAWGLAVLALALDPSSDGVQRLLVAAAITVTLRAAILRRDARFFECIRLAYWAGTLDRDDPKVDA